MSRERVQNEAFSLCFALARLTPCTNLLAFCTGVGWLILGAATGSLSAAAIGIVTRVG